MLSRVQERLDTVEIVDELQYSFIYNLDGTISNNSDISSMDNDAYKDMTSQEQKKELSKVECFCCHEYGHYALNYPMKKGK